MRRAKGPSIIVFCRNKANICNGASDHAWVIQENDTWIPVKLTNEHHEGNKAEVQRILAEHPGENPNHIIKGGRLLGMLQPLRAFGDFKFKWPGDLIENCLGSVLKRQAAPGMDKPI